MVRPALHSLMLQLTNRTSRLSSILNMKIYSLNSGHELESKLNTT